MFVASKRFGQSRYWRSNASSGASSASRYWARNARRWTSSASAGSSTLSWRVDAKRSQIKHAANIFHETTKNVRMAADPCPATKDIMMDGWIRSWHHSLQSRLSSPFSGRSSLVWQHGRGSTDGNLEDDRLRAQHAPATACPTQSSWWNTKLTLTRQAASVFSSKRTRTSRSLGAFVQQTNNDFEPESSGEVILH